MSLQEIYENFPEQKETTIRGRVYDAMGKGVQRIGKGLYVSENAVVELGNSLEIIDRIVEEGDKFEFIFLDIPYEGAGQRGGNRDLFDLDRISVGQFTEFIGKCETLLKTDKSPLLFMFTDGKTSKKYRIDYLNAIFTGSDLKKVCEGSYYKLWKNGNPMNMGKYPMPKENLYVYTKSGQIDNLENILLDFSLTPDFLYPTSKPYPMIEKLVSQFTKIGDWVFDPFGGSGKILKACVSLGRKCHTIDNSENSINNFMLLEL